MTVHGNPAILISPMCSRGGGGGAQMKRQRQQSKKWKHRKKGDESEGSAPRDSGGKGVWKKDGERNGISSVAAGVPGACCLLR